MARHLGGVHRAIEQCEGGTLAPAPHRDSVDATFFTWWSTALPSCCYTQCSTIDACHGSLGHGSGRTEAYIMGKPNLGLMIERDCVCHVAHCLV